MMELLIYDRDEDWYQTVNKAILEVTDYFDFPSSMIAFGESLSSSHLASVEDIAFFRMRNQQLTLITYYCSASDLVLICEDLKACGYTIKSLNYVNKPMDGLKIKRYDDEHMVYSGWNVESIMDSMRHHSACKLRKSISVGEEDYIVDGDVDENDVMGLFYDWVEEAKQRHFMVVQGHYKRYIQRYYTFGDNVRLFGVRRKSDNLLYGIVGYEVFHNNAQMTLCKHRTGDGRFSTYIWVLAVQTMLDEGVEKCFCGTTADAIKARLRMDVLKSYKLVL